MPDTNLTHLREILREIDGAHSNQTRAFQELDEALTEAAPDAAALEAAATSLAVNARETVMLAQLLFAAARNRQRAA